MFKIGLTGGIGSGKSYVADLLAQLGATVIDTDQLAHQLTASNGLAMPLIVQSFGSQMMDASGALDRTAMRQLVFHDLGAKACLEAILHPLIGQAVAQATQVAQGAYIVYVVPLLVESGRWRERVDRICVVDCDEPTQIQRVQKRSGLDTDMIQSIMSVQAGRDERLAHADDVIVNDGMTSLVALNERVRVLHQFWIDMARG